VAVDVALLAQQALDPHRFICRQAMCFEHLLRDEKEAAVLPTQQHAPAWLT
jgi:hypothetical protein